MGTQAKSNTAHKDVRKPEPLTAPLDIAFPGRSALVPRKHGDLENNLKKEVVKTIDEAFGQD